MIPVNPKTNPIYIADQDPANQVYGTNFSGGDASVFHGPGFR